MRRDIFSEDHEAFREQFQRFCAREIEPRIAGWNEAGMSDRDTWKRMGEEGFLGAHAPEAYGGAGGDFLFDAIVAEELAYCRAHAVMMSLHSDICLPYILKYGTDAQKAQYAPGAIGGEILLAIAMTEPVAGSDLAGVQTTARRDGEHYVLNGSKTFISNGQIADLVIVVAKTDADAERAHRGISLFLVEATTQGFVRGRKLDKLGLPGQDTSELFFENCRVPAENLLGGEEGRGFYQMMESIHQERIVLAVGSVASSRRALDDTVAYVKERRAFGQPIAQFQNTQFKLAELATAVEAAQALIDRVLVAHVRGEETVMESSMAKFWATDLQKRVTSECLQLHGGYGFMSEYPISGDYADAAVQSIYGGTNEIMKVIIARKMGLDQR